ncbi:hypothetical protein [Escherichia sp. E1130]|uniref:hypothetical protein n=1 Tax=Escherichia sp. E1130 TaxID=2041645 RepID=UPI001436B5D4|nr:hypothetical protein [Escherichia sp. E1130]
MHFYVDETGHTGPNLFDRTQPVLSSPDDLDKVAEADLAALRKFDQVFDQGLTLS